MDWHVWQHYKYWLTGMDGRGCRLISERVKFLYYMQCGWRYWLMNDQQHRDDGGPAAEHTEDGYCEWWKHGYFMRNNR